MVGTSDYTASNCTTMNEHIVKNVEGNSYGQILGIILAFVKRKRKNSHKITVTIKNPTWIWKQKFMWNNGNHLPDHKVTSLQSHYHDNQSSEMDSQYPGQGSHQSSLNASQKQHCLHKHSWYPFIELLTALFPWGLEVKILFGISANLAKYFPSITSIS